MFFSFIILILISFSVAFGYLTVVSIIGSSDFHYILKSGISGQKLANDLYRHTNLKYPLLFRLYIRVRGDGHRLQSGEYVFKSGSTSRDVLNQIVSGKVLSYSFTIVNGWNYKKVMKTLNKNSLIKHTIENLSPKQIAEKLGFKYASLEGLLLPETYSYTRGTTDLAILSRASRAMQCYIKQVWPKREKHLPYRYRNSYQALTVASMVEKEASLEHEKPLIAAVILKRLKRRMHLQIDPTVIYALGGRYRGALTLEDLRVKSPYNTYINYGLPPTPIAMPGKAAIQAALHPAKTDALYFVSKGDGSHVFSKTLERHDKAVNKYQVRKTEL